jgi:hypothetical protein
VGLAAGQPGLLAAGSGRLHRGLCLCPARHSRDNEFPDRSHLVRVKALTGSNTEPNITRGTGRSLP